MAILNIRVAFLVYKMLERKYQLLRYAHQKIAHLLNVNSAFSDFAGLESGLFFQTFV